MIFCRSYREGIGFDIVRPTPWPRHLTARPFNQAVLELAVNWEAEKLYGVEAPAPSTSFDF